MKKYLLVSFIFLTSILIGSKTSAQVNNPPIARNDTLVFQASAYVIQPNDKLDDLLKRISIITFDNKGKIYIQGEAVERLLVDGSEFF